MQPSGITVLTAIGNAAPASQAGASSVLVEDGDASPGQQFAQLLGDHGAQTQDQGGQPLLLGQLMTVLAGGALAAQEVDGGAVEAQLPEHMPDLSQPITPQEASKLLAQIDVHVQQNPPSPEEMTALSQLKEQLQKIERGGEPKPLAEVIAAVPSVQQEPKLAKPLLALFAALKRPLMKSSESQEASDQASTTPVVPVNFFRALGGAAAPTAAAATAPTAEEKTDQVTDAATTDTPADTVVVLTPTAFETSVPVMPVVASDVTAAPSAPASTAPASRADLDAAIPPLALAPQEDLPQVELPSMAPASAPAAAASAKTESAAASFQDLVSAAPATTDKGQGGDVTALAADTKSAAAFTGLTTPLHLTTHAPVAASHSAPPATLLANHYGALNHAPVSEQVHVAIHQAAQDGLDRITIQLEPMDLGRVEVKMHMNQEGRTQISFVVDKPETFDSLSRDARMLERSLQEAGIKADAGSMQFNLRQQPQPQLHSDLNGQGQPNQQAQLEDEDTEGSVAPSIASVAAFTRNYTVNIREGVDISA